ncbi:hypothetical protein QE152_g15739 [Popillia japonica]|uniref:Uncharacterized protein n=1 Tax=Popillia japonica TaxID=7064 RepID=A0AAW1L772_POPJA
MASKNRPPINPVPPASILRRLSTRNSAINPAPPPRPNRDYADEFVPAYGNFPQEVMLQHYPSYYATQQINAIQEDDGANNDDVDDVYENEEELVQIDDVTADAVGEVGENTAAEDGAEIDKDNQVEYVKPQRKLKTPVKTGGNMVVPSEVRPQKPPDSALYDSRMVHNTEWQNAGINEANLNTTDIKQSDVIPHRLTPRRNRYTYQGAQSNQITNYNPYIRDRNTEAWMKYQEALKRATQSRSPNRKAIAKQPLSKLCVGAEDSPSVEGIEQILGEMENNEMSRIKRDLKDFQIARRRLIYDATNIKPMFSYPPKL